MVKKTPPILTYWTFDEYFDIFNEFYNWVEIIYPETWDYINIYIWNRKEVQHYICWKGNSIINYPRAQKLLWIKFLIEETVLRDVFFENITKNILFVSEELNYLVVVWRPSRMIWSLSQSRRVITMYVKNKKDIQAMYSDSRFTKLHTK